MLSFSTLIPTHYNDGRKVPPDVTAAILAMADHSFGGYTFDAPADGCFQGQRETVRRLTIACSPDRLDDARGLVKRMGIALGQKCMYFSINNDLVELIA